MSQPRRTQAVLLIHGMGEQRPMETLRRFVNAVLPDRKVGPKFFSKPEPLSELYELRTLQNRSQPRTQFFEYYWAHKVSGTKLLHIWRWIFDLLLRRPRDIPHHLRLLWTLGWCVGGLVIGWISLGLGEVIVTEASAIAPLLAPVIAALVYLLQQAVVSHIGDAARYLSPSPGNINLRRAIRADGIALLRRLHESDRFDRIILVGHSLGSVIAYDILRHYWAECHKTYQDPRKDPQHALDHLDARAADLHGIPRPQALDRFQEAQLGLWRENRSLGNPWLVTDLITLGSPLAHAALLMAEDPESLTARQQERELPTCPPLPETSPRSDDKTGSCAFRVWTKYHDEDGHPHSLRAAHGAAPFAVTRWTNLFFPTRLGFFGDPIAGALRPWFGAGIRDIAVTTKRGWLTRFRPRSHTSYWWRSSAASDGLHPPDRDTKDSLDALIYALDLDRLRTTVD